MRYTWLLFATLAACGESASVSRYFDPQQADTLLVNILPYVYVPEGVRPEARFESRFRSAYYLQKQKFSLTRLLRISDGYYYYLLMRSEPDGRRRAFGGRFRAEGTQVWQLEELFVGPALEREVARQRGEFVFRRMVRSRGLPPDLAGMRHYVEWPNERQRYDTLTHTWKFIDSLRVQ
jgi:hypothetical protein